MMKLWLVEARDDLPDDNNPWEPWYDRAFAFVIRAETEEDARKMANEAHGDETSSYDGYPNAWLSAEYSRCTEVTADGPAEIIVREFASA